MDDLSPLMAKSSSKVMSSHIQKLVHVCAVDRLCVPFFFFPLLPLRENFLVGFGGVPIHLREALGFREKGGHICAFGQVFIC